MSIAAASADSRLTNPAPVAYRTLSEQRYWRDGGVGEMTDRAAGDRDDRLVGIVGTDGGLVVPILSPCPETQLARMRTPPLPNADDYARRNAQLITNFRAAWQATICDPESDEKYQVYRGLLAEVRARGIDAGQAILRMAHRTDMAQDDARRYYER